MGSDSSRPTFLTDFLDFISDAGKSITAGPATSALASALAGLTIGGEEIPDLLSSAPLSRGFVLRRKVQAFLPALAAAILPPSLLIASVSPASGFCAAAFAFASAGNVALVTHWTAASERPPVVGRGAQMSPFAAILTQIVCAAWTAAGALAATDVAFWPIPLALAALAAFGARPRATPLRARLSL